jgi:hypothetical protein
VITLDDGIARFRWKDYADGGRVKLMALAAEEFIRRFLLHIVPARPSSPGAARSWTSPQHRPNARGNRCTP